MMKGLRDFADESNMIEGMGPATDAEVKALDRFVHLVAVEVRDLEDYVTIVQPDASLRVNLTDDVRVGKYIAPHGGRSIVLKLEEILDDANNKGMDPHRIHLRYETLHPFSDGNGRSGRALWLWMKNGHAPIGFLHQWYYDTLTSFHGRGDR